MHHIPTSDSATVTLPLSDWRRLERELNDLRTRVQEPAKAWLSAPAPAPDAQKALDADALSFALELVQFAVGNLPPQSVRGWPVEALRRFADLIVDLCPNTHTELLAQEFYRFADEIDAVEKFRNIRRQTARETVGTEAPDAPTPNA